MKLQVYVQYIGHSFLSHFHILVQYFTCLEETIFMKHKQKFLSSIPTSIDVIIIARNAPKNSAQNFADNKFHCADFFASSLQ